MKAVLDIAVFSVMIEVFKTNVEDDVQAKLLLDRIHGTFSNYKANFDLDDCDKILRVKSITGEAVRSLTIISLLRELGFKAEVLGGESSFDKV